MMFVSSRHPTSITRMIDCFHPYRYDNELTEGEFKESIISVWDRFFPGQQHGIAEATEKAEGKQVQQLQDHKHPPEVCTSR